ncbi:hypothetical protein F0U44_06065 [Nocardioides humilatus]|uniref:Ricin B lectin domain-containing protein n=1 Tax=Nocardioides humilatus TaxID=2607660 RepID=A0A5B1LMD0_9ACTN|nr:RICIN domain-containing protein [Nocardioides humilatus]KAA1421832.1 hypothetical protein F0U44_06065 [Nocardioides humilatus]
MNFTTTTTRRRARAAALGLLATILAAPAAVIAAPASTAAPAAPAGASSVVGEVTQTMTYGGRTITVRMQPFALRGPDFEVLLQQADGSLVPQSVGAERGYLGSVDGDPTAVSTAIRRSDGVLEGTVTFDRGATWFFRDGDVYYTRGLTQPTTFKWPSSTTESRNVSTGAGQAGTTTYRWDIGYDLSYDWFTDPTVGSSVDVALDAVEAEVAEMAGLYIQDAMLRPALGRVIIRADATANPYADGTDLLGKVSDEWADNQADSNSDVVMLRSTPDSGGGVAWIGTAGSDWTGASVLGSYADPVVTRHEVGHNWSGRDNHTNGPEGPTVMSGNQFNRFDGTELSAIFRHRDYQQTHQATPPFTPLGTFDVPVPPYAALDLVDNVDARVSRRFRPLANDHDANGDKLTVLSVEPTSHLGGKVSVFNNAITYTGPHVAAADTIDWVKYVVRDATGKTATGVAIFRVDPYVAPPAASTWADVPVFANTKYELTNRQSDYLAAVKAESPATPGLVQRPTHNNFSKFRFTPTGTGTSYYVKNAGTGNCVGTDGALVVQQACDSSVGQRWRVAQHPKGGAALVNVGSGQCLTPKDDNMTIGAVLAQATCSLKLNHAWDVAVPAVSTWPAAAPADPTKQYQLRNGLSGLFAGLPAGSGGYEELVQRAKGIGARFSFTANGDGTWAIREVSTNQCVDGYGSSDAGTWSCHSGDNQKWKVLQHPAGGVALVNVDTGTCLAPAGDATTAGTLLVRRTCDGSPAVQWSPSVVTP